MPPKTRATPKVEIHLRLTEVEHTNLLRIMEQWDCSANEAVRNLIASKFAQLKTELLETQS